MTTCFAKIRRGLAPALVAGLALGVAGPARAGDPEPSGMVRNAIAYLDGRQDAWAKFNGSGRGEKADRTTCVSCHTGVPFVLARDLVGRSVGEASPSDAGRKMVADVALRVDHWADLDSPRFRLMYDHDARKKVESRGTEAVLDALVLARADAAAGLKEPGPKLRDALAHLWEKQATSGDDAGSWDWLNFGLAPWEADGSRAFGATLAAIAVGSAPGYLSGKLDEAETRGLASLRDYLRRRFPAENAYNRLWILEASATLDGILSDDQKREVLGQLRAARLDDGGWSLAAMGPYDRLDGSKQPADSDGYGTGLAVHLLLRSGAAATDPDVAKGLDWLRAQQRADGSWPGRSVNKERDPASFIGRLMSDAATSFAALALVEAEPRPAESPSSGR